MLPLGICKYWESLKTTLLFIAGFQHDSKNTDSKVQKKCDGQQCLNEPSPGICWISILACYLFCEVAGNCYTPVLATCH